MIETAGLGVFGDIGIDQPDLAILGMGIALADGGLAGTERFHLRADQHDPSLQRLANGIGVTRLAVVGDQLVAVVFLFRHETFKPQPAMASRTRFWPASVSSTNGRRTSGVA